MIHRIHLKTIRNPASGFSLMELMIVVAILGILATIAYPRLEIYQARARQSEAKTFLAAIRKFQEMYFLDHNAYIDMPAIGYNISHLNRPFLIQDILMDWLQLGLTRAYAAVGPSADCTNPVVVAVFPECPLATFEMRYVYEVTLPTATSFVATAASGEYEDNAIRRGCVSDVWRTDDISSSIVAINDVTSGGC